MKQRQIKGKLEEREEKAINVHKAPPPPHTHTQTISRIRIYTSKTHRVTMKIGGKKE